MNTRNLKRTRDYLAAHPGHYNQEIWANPCGTPACVAGAAVVGCGGRILSRRNYVPDQCVTADGAMETIPNYAEELLGLDRAERGDMFHAFPYQYRERTADASPPSVEEALAMLDYAIEHGKVRWPPRTTKHP